MKLYHQVTRFYRQYVTICHLTSKIQNSHPHRTRSSQNLQGSPAQSLHSQKVMEKCSHQNISWPLARSCPRALTPPPPSVLADPVFQVIPKDFGDHPRKVARKHVWGGIGWERNAEKGNERIFTPYSKILQNGPPYSQRPWLTVDSAAKSGGPVAAMLLSRPKIRRDVHQVDSTALARHGP